MSQSFTNATTLDDTSSNVTYSGSWVRHDNIPSGYNLYHNTDAWSDEQGATAALTFYGTSVDYWGDQEYTRGPCEIAIDGAVVTTVNANAPVVTGEVIQLFTSGNLPLGQHTLVIKVASALSANRCEVDRFVVSTSINAVATPTPTTSSITRSVSASTPVTTTPSTGVTQATNVTNNTSLHSMPVSTTSGVGVFISLPTATATTPASANVAEVGTKGPKSSVSIGAIIGVTFGAIALLCLFNFLWWFYKRPQRLRRRPFSHLPDSNSEVDSLDADSLPDPFAPLPYPITLPRTKAMEAFGSVASLQSSFEAHIRAEMDDQGHSNYSQVPSSFVAGTETIVMPITGSGTGPLTTNLSTISGSKLSTMTEECPPAYYEA